MTRWFVSCVMGTGVAALLLIGALAAPLVSAARAVDDEGKPPVEPQLRVEGEVETPLRLEAADLTQLPRRTVQATEHGGTRAEFEGVPLFEILQRAGAPLGERLRGEAATSYVVVGASDGYRAVFSLAELDPAFRDGVVLLADRRDGKPMSKPEGPFRIIVPDEKRHARWVRMVESLTVQRAPQNPPASQRSSRLKAISEGLGVEPRGNVFKRFLTLCLWTFCDRSRETLSCPYVAASR